MNQKSNVSRRSFLQATGTATAFAMTAKSYAALALWVSGALGPGT